MLCFHITACAEPPTADLDDAPCPPERLDDGIELAITVGPADSRETTFFVRVASQWGSWLDSDRITIPVGRSVVIDRFGSIAAELPAAS